MDHCSFEPYHVPQQSRRDKLRLISQSNPLPLPPPPPSSPFHPDFPNSIKQETSNFMGFVYNSHNFILDPQNQDITTTNPFLSSLPLQLPLPVPPQTQTQTQHNHFRVFDQIQPPNDQDAVFRTDQVSNVSNGQGLSLSLSSKQTNNNSINHFQRIFNTNNNEDNNLLLMSSRSSVPLGPFTGYASILKGSRFLRPAQLLLDELCDVGNGIYAADKFEDDVGLTDPSSDHDFNTGDGLIDDTLCSTQGTNRQRKKSTLVSMLHEVYRMYKFYYQQMHAVVASFETVAGLGNAAPYANLALKAMSKDFRSLKDAITDQLQSSYNSNQNDDDLSSSLGNNSNPALYRKPVHNNSDGFMDHQPVWRPQRGLPERAVTVLRAWLFEHFLHPYPTDADKIMLAKKTGLSRSQVSNWFINARVRLWKPMVEEIHMLETRQQTQKTDCQKDQHHQNNNHLPIATSSLDQNRLNSIQKSHQLELPSKRGRDDFDSSSIGHHQEQQQPLSVPYDNLSRLDNFLGNSNNGGGSVSLTLGLHHQNNGMALVPDQTYPTARRLGLDVNMNNNNNNNNEGYMFGGFEGQNRPFIREIMGGQLLHDFVG